jgi:ABC-type transport system substrate-binding protein
MKLFSLILVVLLCSQCAPKKDATKKIFEYNEITGIASLDPAFAKNQSIMWAIHQLFNTLVEVDSNMQLKTSIAKKYSFSTDRKTVSFVLRNDIFFHDNPCFTNGKGRRLTAQDVVYSFSRLIDKEVASPGSWIFNDRIDTVQPFLAVNDTVFELRLQKPFNPILGILSMQYCSIVPKEAVDFYGSKFRSNPVGTGPFSFLVWEEGQALVLRKNANYFEQDSTGKKLPYLDGIKVNFYRIFGFFATAVRFCK